MAFRRIGIPYSLLQRVVVSLMVCFIWTIVINAPIRAQISWLVMGSHFGKLRAPSRLVKVVIIDTTSSLMYSLNISVSSEIWSTCTTFCTGPQRRFLAATRPIGGGCLFHLVPSFLSKTSSFPTGCSCCSESLSEDSDSEKEEGRYSLSEPLDTRSSSPPTSTSGWSTPSRKASNKFGAIAMSKAFQ